MSVDVGEVQTAPSGGLLNKRNLILGALAIGAIGGLFVFLSRKNAPQATGNGVTGPSASSQTDLQLGNIATQLLQFEGQTSQQNSDVLTHIDNAATTIGAQVSAGDVSNQTRFTSLWDMLNSSFLNLVNQNEADRQSIASGQAALSGQILDSYNGLATGEANLGRQTNEEFIASQQHVNDALAAILAQYPQSSPFSGRNWAPFSIYGVPSQSDHNGALDSGNGNGSELYSLNVPTRYVG